LGNVTVNLLGLLSKVTGTPQYQAAHN